MELYVSDLDGTLLNSEQRISSVSIKIINDLIEKGMKFSIATARSFTSAQKIIKPLNLKLPMVLHNGVFVFDPVERKNILSNYMDNDSACEIAKLFMEMGISPIVYTRDENEESKVYYKGIFNDGEEHYIKDRLASNDRRFTQTDDLLSCFSKNVITILAIGKKEELVPAYKYVTGKYDFTCHYTVDIYSKAVWLELTHKNANKRDAIKYLKDFMGFEKLVCFGDNLNDIPMFEIADEKYAVENAHELLKKNATGIIGCNDDDGVAKYLKSTIVFN